MALLGGLSARGAVAAAGPTPDQPAPSPQFHPRTTLETVKGVVPTAYQYPSGNPRRYGAMGSGWAHDDTAALQTCIDCNNSVTFNQGDIYGVTSVTFPAGGPDVVDFNGAYIVGIATMQTPCIVAIKSSYTIFYGYQVFGLGNGKSIPNPNPNYACATWWYNPAGGSQFVTFFGMLHSTCNRAVVYGSLPGTHPTGGLQSENSIYGFRTVGCANPFFSNAQGGFIHFSEPIFYAGFENWTTPPVATARALENYLGAIFAQGGELEFASRADGFAADLQSCILQGMNFETAPPIQIIGNGVQIVGGSLYNTASITSEFVVAKGVAGALTITGSSLARGPGAGAFSRIPMIDASAASPEFETVLQNTISREWAWSLVGADCELVKGGRVCYRNHRMRITTADHNVYVLTNSPTESMVSPAFDHLGYTTKGWSLVSSTGTQTLVPTAVPGPAGYLASQLTLTSTATAEALCGDPASLETIQATCLRVRPGELYWTCCWLQNESAQAAGLIANFYTTAGKLTSPLAVADTAAIGSRSWRYVEGPIAVPPSAAYMSFGIQASGGGVLITDLRIRRAG